MFIGMYKKKTLVTCLWLVLIIAGEVACERLEPRFCHYYLFIDSYRIEANSSLVFKRSEATAKEPHFISLVSTYFINESMDGNYGPYPALTKRSSGVQQNQKKRY